MAAINIIRRRSILSESAPAGILTIIPTTVDAAAIKPTVDIGTPRERINNGNTGFFAIVELKMANPPSMHSTKKEEIFAFISLRETDRPIEPMTIHRPNINKEREVISRCFA